MGQKTHPIGLRVGIHRKWNESWHAEGLEYKTLFFAQHYVEEVLKYFFYFYNYTKTAVTKRVFLMNAKFIKPGNFELYIFGFFYKLRSRRRLFQGKQLRKTRKFTDKKNLAQKLNYLSTTLFGGSSQEKVQTSAATPSLKARDKKLQKTESSKLSVEEQRIKNKKAPSRFMKARENLAARLPQVQNGPKGNVEQLAKEKLFREKSRSNKNSHKGRIGQNQTRPDTILTKSLASTHSKKEWRSQANQAVLNSVKQTKPAKQSNLHSSLKKENLAEIKSFEVGKKTYIAKKFPENSLNPKQQSQQVKKSDVLFTRSNNRKWDENKNKSK